MSEYDVFICSRRDGSGDVLSQILYTHLQQDGYRVFYSVESIRSGIFDEVIRRSIASSKAVLALLSPHSLDRCMDADDLMRQELEYAIVQRKTMIPVVMRGFEWPETHNLPWTLRDLPMLNVFLADTENFNRCYIMLKAVIDESVGREKPAETDPFPKAGPTPYRGPEPYIFISYSHKDIVKAMTIIARLQSDGYRVWYDEGIDPGTEWADEIAAFVEECSCFIALMSRNYLDSDNCIDELELARDEKKRRLLVYLENTTLEGGLRMRHSRLQNIHKYKYADEEQFYKKLYETQGIQDCRSEEKRTRADYKRLPEEPADRREKGRISFSPADPMTADIIPAGDVRASVYPGDGAKGNSEPFDGTENGRFGEGDTDTGSTVNCRYPPLTLPNPGVSFNTQDHSREDHHNAVRIEETLKMFNIPAEVKQVTHGPAVTRFAVRIAPGIRIQKVTGMADNLALSLATRHVRVEAPIQGTDCIGIEVPNREISTVSLREVLESEQMRMNPSPLAVALGKDIEGTPVVCDLCRMPHLLIAGATGSGKSVCIHSIVCSFLYRASPQQVRIIMIDPGQAELLVYNGVPHLLIPVVTDVRKASGALGWAVQEMQDRYARFSRDGVRNLEGYNRQHEKDGMKLPNIVIIIDEMADLMDVCRKDVEEYIRRLAALARAAGIHMVLATRRPSVDVITGVIKNNIPSRIAFAVSSGIDSRTILDTVGAEKLMGKGDMLYKPSGMAANRVQGCFVSRDEVMAFADYIRSRYTAEYNQGIIEQLSKTGNSAGENESGAEDNAAAGSDTPDRLLQEAIGIAVEDGQISVSMLQRRLRIGYARAGRLVYEMEERGIVSAQDGSGPRKTLITREQYQQMLADGAKKE